MTCDDDAWLKDNAIQKEMGFRIKPAFTCFQALSENSIEKVFMECILMYQAYSLLLIDNRAEQLIFILKFCFKNPHIGLIK